MNTLHMTAELAAGALLLPLLLLLAIFLASRSMVWLARGGGAFRHLFARWLQEHETTLMVGLWAVLVLAAALAGPLLMLDLTGAMPGPKAS